MKAKELKTIDINCKHWFDKVNGNSYFCGTVTTNFCLEGEKIFLLPFQYGYSTQQETKSVLTELNLISPNYGQSLNTYCKENDIILRSYIQHNCKKKELREIETSYNANLK